MLIVVDAQKEFVTDTDHISRIKQLAEESEDVLFTKFTQEVPDRYTSEVNWNGLTEDAAKIHEKLRGINSKYPVIERAEYGVGASKELIRFAKNQDEVYLAGFETDACILSISFDLFDNDICPTVIEDACYTNAGAEIHESAIEILRRSIGGTNIKKTSEVLRDIE